MSRKIMLIPTDTNVGLRSVVIGVMRAIENKGISISFFKPITQSKYNENSNNVVISTINTNSIVSCAKSLDINYVESLLISNQKNKLMEEIITCYYKNINNTEVFLIEGLIPTNKHQFITTLNYEIASMINAEIVLVSSIDNYSPNELKKCISLACLNFGGWKNKIFTGIIINKLNAPLNNQNRNYLNLLNTLNNSKKYNSTNLNLSLFIESNMLPILGCIPWNLDLIAIRVVDVVRHLNATIVNKGEMQIRRLKYIISCAFNLQDILQHFRPDSLLIISSNHQNMLIAICLAIINGIKIGAILLTDGYEIDLQIKRICEDTFKTGLPVFTVNTNILQTLLDLQNFSLKTPIDDYIRIEKSKNYIANHINSNWVKSLSIKSKRSQHLSPFMFRYKLKELAQQAKKRIILPEGNEPRTLKAASICAEDNIANCVLLGNPDNINYVAATQNIKLSSNIEIIDPETIREKYLARLIELRKNKGMTEIIARKQLEDNVVLGTLMLEQNEVDGMISGAIHTTANTIRPPLQLIKTAPGNSLVSSIFFMLLPEQVLVYGDCAINKNPTSEQLAEIAIQSAESASAFGIEPRIAMISYSTGNSAESNDIEKVRKATMLALKRRPDLLIDGPMQYDTAIIHDVALLKAPHSLVAGQATVLIFPDLNTGNTTYKAVQRSANITSIGPMLQGMCKPVNDLSRGALIDDIVYTIALTAIQSTNQQNTSKIISAIK